MALRKELTVGRSTADAERPKSRYIMEILTENLVRELIYLKIKWFLMPDKIGQKNLGRATLGSTERN